jgi:hypothetical protein
LELILISDFGIFKVHELKVQGFRFDPESRGFSPEKQGIRSAVPRFFAAAEKSARRRGPYAG